MDIPRVVIAGTASGVGKTTITCAIIYGMQQLGYSVQPFKAGPDYIDPSHLSAISHNEAGNLDPWLMGDDAIPQNFADASHSDISVVEGVMGYYDGFAGDSDFASTFDVASRLRSPVILVLDASRMSRSIAAVAAGFARFRPNSRISGLILNRVASPKHERLCRQALEPLGIPLLGVIPRSKSRTMKSRHLGLVPAAEQGGQEDVMREIASDFSKYLDIHGVVSLCRQARPLSAGAPPPPKSRRVTIAVALDGSFNFYYRENLNALRRQGAEIRFFSPLRDDAPPECDGLYIGGGFPEVMGPELSQNHSMLRSIRKLAEDGTPIYAECGGLMYLTRMIRYEQKRYPMVGLFDATTMMTKKMTLNYTRGDTIQDCIISGSGVHIHAHEFHYSVLESIPSDSKFAYKLTVGRGITDGHDGLISYDTLASYCHLYLTEKRASNLVDACAGHARR